jgi:hypothetical protein
MSSSYRNLVGLVALGAATVAGAADTYFTPQLDAGVEYHTDRDMTPEGVTPLFKEDVVGYVANVGGTAGVRTQRGLTELRPRLQLLEYPDRDDLQKVNAYLDLRSQYTNLLSRWDLAGRFRREDRSEAQFVDAGYDDFDPNDPVVDSAGRISFIEETMTDWQLRPQYRRNLNERMGFGFGGFYSQAQFESDSTVTSGQDYASWQADSFLFWGLRERTQITSGLYAARFDTDDDSNKTQGYGLSFDVDHSFSEVLSGLLAIDVERTEVDQRSRPTEESTNFGVSVGLVSRGEISQWRVTAGRTISPSSYGSRANVDQIRVQHLRNLSPRFRLSAALRAFRSRPQGDTVSNDGDRDYLRGELDLIWELSRTWSLSGGYSYTRQEYATDPGPGDNSVFAIRIGYTGLAPQRR